MDEYGDFWLGVATVAPLLLLAQVLVTIDAAKTAALRFIKKKDPKLRPGVYFLSATIGLIDTVSMMNALAVLGHVAQGVRWDNRHYGFWFLFVGVIGLFCTTLWVGLNKFIAETAHD